MLEFKYVNIKRDFEKSSVKTDIEQTSIISNLIAFFHDFIFKISTLYRSFNAARMRQIFNINLGQFAFCKMELFHWIEQPKLSILWAHNANGIFNINSKIYFVRKQIFVSYEYAHTQILMHRHAQWKNERLTIEFIKTKAKLAQITELEFVFKTFINYLATKSLPRCLQFYFYIISIHKHVQTYFGCNNFSYIIHDDAFSMLTNFFSDKKNVF